MNIFEREPKLDFGESEPEIPKESPELDEVLDNPQIPEEEKMSEEEFAEFIRLSKEVGPVKARERILNKRLYKKWN